MGKFKIPIIPSTTNKSIRFPNNLIQEVEDAIQGKESNFTAFVIEAVKVALKDLKESETNSVSKNSYPNVLEEQMAVCEDDKN